MEAAGIEPAVLWESYPSHSLTAPRRVNFIAPMRSALRGCCLAVVLALLIPSVTRATELPTDSQNEVPSEAVPSKPAEAPAAPVGSPGPSTWALLAAGLMGEAVLFFPMTLTGAFIGSLKMEPCDDHCDGVTYWRLGATIGGSLGVGLGAGGGMMLMGAAQGSQASWLATFGGATLGSTLGLVVILSTENLRNTGFDKPFPFLVPPAGALVGALVGYQLSRTAHSASRFPLNGTQVALMLGGATLGSIGGIAAVFLINDFFYYPTPFLGEDKPWRFLLPLAGAGLGAWGGYALGTLVTGPSQDSAAAPVRMISGVAPLPGGGMVSVVGRF
jgi:hypothetical protein